MGTCPRKGDVAESELLKGNDGGSTEFHEHVNEIAVLAQSAREYRQRVFTSIYQAARYGLDARGISAHAQGWCDGNR